MSVCHRRLIVRHCLFLVFSTALMNKAVPAGPRHRRRPRPSGRAAGEPRADAIRYVAGESTESDSHRLFPSMPFVAAPPQSTVPFIAATVDSVLEAGRFLAFLPHSTALRPHMPSIAALLVHILPTSACLILFDLCFAISSNGQFVVCFLTFSVRCRPARQTACWPRPWSRRSRYR